MILSSPFDSTLEDGHWMHLLIYQQYEGPSYYLSVQKTAGLYTSHQNLLSIKLPWNPLWNKNNIEFLTKIENIKRNSMQF